MDVHDLIGHLRAHINALGAKMTDFEGKVLALEQSVKEMAEAMAAHAMPDDGLRKVPRGVAIEAAEDQKGDKDWVPEAPKKKGSD